MTADATLKTLLTRITLPPQDLAQLSFCDGSKPARVEAWTQALPLTRISFVSGLLYKALPEVTRLKTTAAARLEMAEALRPATQHCIHGLSQSFLNQPLILPEAARKTATVAQALQKHLTNIYLMVVRDSLLDERQATEEIRSRQALAVHRGMTGLGLLLLRSYQLYTPTPSRFWEEIHSLYLVAETLGIENAQISDPLSDHEQADTVQKAYLRLLLLACARPNQLRQDEVSTTYRSLNQLVEHAQLLPYDPEQKNNLFAVMLDSNRPPLYKSRLPQANSSNSRELGTNALIALLTEESSQKSGGDNAHRNRFGLTPSLTLHLTSAWNVLSLRSFERRAINGQVELTIGLSNLHFHLAGEPFNLFLNQGDSLLGEKEKASAPRPGLTLKAAPSKQEDDPWGDAFDVGGTRLTGSDLATFNIEDSIRQRQQADYTGQHPTHFVPMMDVSSGGYCLEWRAEIPAQVKAGEILGVREEGRQKWSLGVIRWVQQTLGATQLGVQLIAPQAIPVGVAVIYKTGGYSEYLRGLLIPALRGINQPETLITNTVSFREYSKVSLFRPDDQRTVQLTRRLFSTGAISQFTFRELASAVPGNDAQPPSQNFDDIWN